MKHCLTSILCAASLASAGSIAPYNIVWDSPSQDSLDSMPLSGRHGAGANVWVQDGSIWLYLSHNGAYDEQGRLLKLGCVRITPVNVPLGKRGFRQELDLASGTITVEQGAFKTSLWFAGETLVFDSHSDPTTQLDVSFATWRDKQRDGIRHDMGGNATFMPDHVEVDNDGFRWFHRNADHPHDVIGTAGRQGIPAETVHDLTTRRVFGGAIEVGGGISPPVPSDVKWQFWEGKAWTGRTLAGKSGRIAMTLGAKPDADPQSWRKQARSMLDPATSRAARIDEQKRWSEFWSRSHIVINPDAGVDDPGWLVGRNYQLFRYMLACNRGGELPLLFNGGIFTIDNNGRIKGNNNDELPIFAGEPTTPDFRRWMFCRFMAQNQRWLGWPTLAGGDADLLAPSLACYRDRSATAAARAKIHGAEGVLYPEPLDIWGLCAVAPRPDGLCAAEHLTYHFSMMLEHAWMALQARDAMGYDISKDLEWITGTVLFYDSYYRSETKKRTGKELGDDGKLVLYPSHAVEFAVDATNPVEVVSGLRRVVSALLALPDLPAPSRERLQAIQPTLPDLPVGKRQRRLSVLPATSFGKEYNAWEPVELFAAWPYRLMGITRPDTLQLARDTWETIPSHRAAKCKQDFSWMPNVANMAALAWPDQAKERAIWKMANTAAPQARFPAFFGPGHDWLPDHNWGGSGMTGIQEMLLAPEPGPQGKLNLFPGWPADWDVEFKLHAPGPTVVEVVYRKGRVEKLEITPSRRAKDIVNWLGKIPAYQQPAKPLSQGRQVTASSLFDQPGYDPAMAVDGDIGTRWASDIDARSGWLEVDLGAEREIASVLLSEIEWPETREFTIEIKQGDTWAKVAGGTTIGRDKEISFPPVMARHVRLNVLKSERAININEFQVFPP